MQKHYQLLNYCSLQQWREQNFTLGQQIDEARAGSPKSVVLRLRPLDAEVSGKWCH